MACCLQAAAYEACRVFRDRLVHSDHTARFDSILTDTLQKHWRVKLNMASSVFATIGGSALQVKTVEPGLCHGPIFQARVWQQAESGQKSAKGMCIVHNLKPAQPCTLKLVHPTIASSLIM